jgi:hypothetical protein
MDMDMDMESMRINNAILTSESWIFRMFRELLLQKGIALAVDQ